MYVVLNTLLLCLGHSLLPSLSLSLTVSLLLNNTFIQFRYISFIKHPTILSQHFQSTFLSLQFIPYPNSNTHQLLLTPPSFSFTFSQTHGVLHSPLAQKPSPIPPIKFQQRPISHLTPWLSKHSSSKSKPPFQTASIQSPLNFSRKNLPLNPNETLPF